MPTSRTADSNNRRATWVLVLTSIASLMVALDVLVVSTALSTIRVQLHASLVDLEWTVNAYVLSFAVLLMTAQRWVSDWGGGGCWRPAWGCSLPRRRHVRSRREPARWSRPARCKAPARRWSCRCRWRY